MKRLVYDSDVCIYQLCVDRFIQVFKKKNLLVYNIIPIH